MDASPLESSPTPPAGPVKPAPGGRLAGQLYQLVHPAARPDRYFLRQEGAVRYLCCRDAPEVKVRVEHGLSFTAGAAHKAAEGSIFLDGVAQGPPFLDAERRVFNLDHHADCVRQFTLASCEQAFVLVRRGLDLRERLWTLYATDPDLDTVLAIWVLLNTRHVSDSPEVRAAVAPLVRVEGTLDVHGREGLDLTGMPRESLVQALERLDELRRNERTARRGGPWSHVDAPEFTAVQLRAIDAMVFPADHFVGYRHVEALATAELSDQRVAVVCRSDGGIYEAEEDLKRIYGKRLGLIALEKEPHVYTLRQVDAFLAGSLEHVYAALNVLDPAVHSGSSRNRWGGSAEIGGSPRRTGTRLSPQEIAEACRQAYRKPGWKERLTAGAASILAVVLALAAGGPAVVERLAPALRTSPAQAAGHGAGMVLVAALFLALYGRRRPRLFGWRLPGGWDWLWLAPLAALGAAAGGVWSGSPGGAAAERVAILLVFPLAAELIFRGVAHGILARTFPIQHDGGRWFLSIPTISCAALYAAATLLLPTGAAAFGGPWAWLVPFAGALVFGFAAGAARERSSSVLAPLILHWCGALLAAFTVSRIAGLLV